MTCQRCPHYTVQHASPANRHVCGITGANLPSEDRNADLRCPCRLDLRIGWQRRVAQTVAKTAAQRGTLDALLGSYPAKDRSLLKLLAIT